VCRASIDVLFTREKVLMAKLGSRRQLLSRGLPELVRPPAAAFIEQTLVISARDDVIESIAGKLDRTMHKDITL